jgi:prophage regulatory protein
MPVVYLTPRQKPHPKKPIKAIKINNYTFLDNKGRLRTKYFCIMIHDIIKDTKMTPQILRRKDVEATVGLSRSTIYHLISQGLFPAPIKLGKRAVGWKVSDIETWVNDRTST